MAATKSKSRKGKDASRNEANENANKASYVATSKGKQMADTPSVIEFEEDISSQEAPVPLPVGDYTAEIRGAERKIGKSSGNPYAAVTFFIPSEQYPADYTEGEPEGTVLTHNSLSLKDTPASRYRVRRFCEAIGAPMGKSIDLNDWVGRTANVTIQHGEFEGVKKAEIGKVSAA